MADDNTDPVPQRAIPPKAVPLQTPVAGSVDNPTVRRQTMPAPASQGVRLRPVGGGAMPAAPAPGLPASATPATGPGSAQASAEAAEAIKRMTARIVMMSGDTEPGGSKMRPGHMAAPGVEAGAKKTAPLAAAVEGEASVTKVASRIQMSTTAPIPELSDIPRTIKIRPSVGTQAGTSAPSGAQMEPSTPYSQQLGGKAKTSRIPLESAMSVPQSGGATADHSSGPKTIKLKRPGEMSTIKVSSPGAVAMPSVAPAAGNEPAADDANVTQKKTIRVKRPSAPVVTSPGSGGSDGAGDPGLAGMVPVAFVPVAPERGTGWFIAVAVACILVISVMLGYFMTQLRGWPMHTELDSSFQKG